MFEIQIGDRVSVPSSIFREGVFLTGRSGQGKSTTYLVIALAIIKHKQRGIIYDPYGDLAKAIQEKISTKKSVENVCFFSDKISQSELKKQLAAGKIVVVASQRLTEGERITRQKGQKFLKMACGLLKKDDWFIVDEAFTFADDEIIKMYAGCSKKGLHFMLSDDELSKLSVEERQEFCKLIPNYIVYKIQNFDAICLGRHVSSAGKKQVFEPKSIAAIRQYHYQLALNVHSMDFKGIKYIEALWPIKVI